jgi:hypothetical protein
MFRSMKFSYQRFICISCFFRTYCTSGLSKCSLCNDPESSSVSIVTGFWLDERDSGVRFSAGVGNFSLLHRVQTCSGAPPNLLSNGHQGLKRPGCEAGHSTRSSAEVKNALHYTSTPQYVSMAWCLVKHRDNFTLPYLTLEETTWET